MKEEKMLKGLLRSNRKVGVLVFALLGLLATPLATAQNFPSRPITIYTGFPPGGGNDAVARVIGEQLSKTLKQSVIVDSKIGAGGEIANAFVGRAAPDGYTLFLAGNGSMSISPVIHPDIPYDPMKFTPIGMVATAGAILVARKDFPYHTVPEIIQYAKANPGKLTFASSGIGAATHLAGELFNEMAGIDILHVPYKGASQAVTDVIGGRVDFYYAASSATASIKSGQLRAIAVTSKDRLENMPDIPPIGEYLPGYDFNYWYALFAPPGTPESVARTLAEAVAQALQVKTVQQQLAALELRPQDMRGAELRNFVASEIAKTRQIAKAANIVRAAR
ncbi:hypothetical protein CAL12_10715 [Bordetella genomosp. 8]|uniref:Twin-arginine translocation pathway signal n=1 Tax=Bordetella genomosp. 8 TaxID=1416806 RepID=A0A1W6YJJ1_9BORD|nr:hypothetical protein CAL12_10715 [Bordetella genomosp. 8]